MRALIIDDDIDSRFILKSQLGTDHPGIIIEAEAGSVKEASAMITTHQPDLLFLDIELPDGTAFDLLEGLQADRHFEIIFITAFNEYAVQAFKQAAMGYLLKPVAAAELSEAVKRAEERIREKNFREHLQALFYNNRQKESYERKLAVATTDGFVFIPVKEIHWLESRSNYTTFHFSQQKKLVSSRTLGYYEELLPDDYFYRIHHSHIVNISCVEKYIKGGAGGSLVMNDGTILPVSQRKKDAVYNRLIKGM